MMMNDGSRHSGVFNIPIWFSPPSRISHKIVDEKQNVKNLLKCVLSLIGWGEEVSLMAIEK